MISVNSVIKFAHIYVGFSNPNNKGAPQIGAPLLFSLDVVEDASLMESLNCQVSVLQ